MQNILIIGGGFAGVWSGMGAMRALEEVGGDPAEVRVTLVSRDPYLTIRPRLYEADLAEVRVPLDSVLAPIGVGRIEAEVTGIDPEERVVTMGTGSSRRSLRYDRLVLAAGSRLHRPEVPGLREHAFSVDTYAEAAALDRHLSGLTGRPAGADHYAAVVIGSGFTGLEVATTLMSRLLVVAGEAGAGHEVRVVLVEQAEVVAPELGANPRPLIEAALAQLGIELRLRSTAASIHPEGVQLADGEWIPAATTVWTGGMRASPLAAHFPVVRDALGRLPVDEVLRVEGVDGVFAAGDVARAMADARHPSLMSCQHAIPMGMHAGYNAVADLLGEEPVPYAQPDYVTCLDLGAAGAIFTRGWNRQVRATGRRAKQIKEEITMRLIYPPRSAERRAILDAVAIGRSVSAGPVGVP